MINLDFVNNHNLKYGNLYKTYGLYYNGKHRNYFKDFSERNNNHKELAEIIKTLKDNMCKVVVDSISARLELNGFVSENEETQAWLDNYFRKKRITSIAKAIHRDCILYGDAYLTVWTDEKGFPVIKHEKPYNMFVKYNINDEIECAVKWVVEKITESKKISRYWIYTKDKIYLRYKESESIPTDFNSLLCYPEEDYIDNPYGTVPVFHFSNGIRPDAFCRSDLGDIIPLQIALNKEMQMREMGADLNGFKQKYLTGVQIPVDENGKPIATLRSTLDSVWTFSNSDMKIGEFSAIDLGNYTSAINDLREEISRVSRVPFHVMGLGGNFPSGEALKTAEAPLIAKIKDKQLVFGDVWEDVFKFVLKLAGIEEEFIEAKWENTQPHSEKEKWEIALLKKESGVATDKILSEMGYTQEEIDDFNLKAQEQAQMSLNAFNGIGNI